MKTLALLLIFDLGFIAGTIWADIFKDNKNTDKHMGDEK